MGHDGLQFAFQRELDFGRTQGRIHSYQLFKERFELNGHQVYGFPGDLAILEEVVGQSIEANGGAVYALHAVTADLVQRRQTVLEQESAKPL